MDGAHKSHKILILAVLLAVFTLLGMAVGSWAVDKINGDPAVLNDIDKHFEAITTHAKNEDAPSPTAVSDHRAPVEEEAPSAAESRTGAKKGKSKKPLRRRRPSVQPTATSLPLWPGIQEIAPATYTIAAPLFDSARSDYKPFIRGIRAVLSEANGAPEGFRILGVQPGSALFAIGLRHGDVLTSVNGHNLGSVDEALLAAATLKTSRRFRVDLKRYGQPMSLYYRVIEN